MERWKGSELVYQALSGVMYENGCLEGPPLYGIGHRASYAAGVLGYTQSVATLLGDFGPRVVDVAIAEVAPRCRSIASRNSATTGRSRGATSAPFRARSCAARTAG